MRLLKHCMLSMILMGTSMSCLMPSWITGRILMRPSLGTIRSRSLMVRRLSHAPHAVRSCVVNGRTAIYLGRNCLTSRSLTLFRSLSLHLLWALPVNQPSTGGLHGSSRRETVSSPWLSAEALDTTRGPTSLGLSSPKLWMRLTQSTMPLVHPFA